jgi:error-prone DNA polymerase
MAQTQLGAPGREANSREQPALRLGLGLVKGLSDEAAKRLVAARAMRRFTDVEDLAHRAALNAHDMRALAAAGALAALSGHRRNALWDVSGIETPRALLAGSPIVETIAHLAAPEAPQRQIAGSKRECTLGQELKQSSRHRTSHAPNHGRGNGGSGVRHL